MAKNLIFLGKLSERKAELQALRTAKASEVEEVKQKLNNARVLVTDMGTKAAYLEAVKEYDPEYVESETAAIKGFIAETIDKTRSLQALLKEKENENILLANEYTRIDKAHQSADAEDLQVEALQASVSEL